MMDSSNNVLFVLVVDDTVVYRRILQNVVAEISNAKVVGVAANGRIALERLEQLEVDVVLLDVEMPEMDGIETLKEIRCRWPGIGVVLLSGANKRSADMTMRALDLGALDFVPKADTGDVQRNQRQLVQQLDAIFRGFERRRRLGLGRVGKGVDQVSGGQTKGGALPSIASARGNEDDRRRSAVGEVHFEPTTLHGLGKGRPNRSTTSTQSARLGESGAAAASVPSVRPIGAVPDVLLIGCSTGGPQALASIIPLLPADLGVPVLVVQHMPPVFTASLAESLNRSSALTVCEASAGQVVESNKVFLAPGGRHMTVYGERGRGEHRIAISDEPPVNSCRPSVDVLFRSAVAVFGGATLSVILTGMGEDGLEGVRALRVAGGKTLVQSEETCVVYGMPRAIDLAGFTDESVAIEAMASKIVRWLRQG